MEIRKITLAMFLLFFCGWNYEIQAQEMTPRASRLQSNSIDVSQDFADFTHIFFLLTVFHPLTLQQEKVW